MSKKSDYDSDFTTSSQREEEARIARELETEGDDASPDNISDLTPDVPPTHQRQSHRHGEKGEVSGSDGVLESPPKFEMSDGGSA